MLAPNNKVIPTPGPLPGTEPGAGWFKAPKRPYAPQPISGKTFFSRLAAIWNALWGLLIAGLVLAAFTGTLDQTVTISDTKFTVEVADELDEQVRGLSGTLSLKPGNGMLFAYEREDYWGAWMLDMNYPIDIVWLDSNKRVINVHSNIGPETFPQSFLPNRPAMYFLEIPAGAAEAAGIKEGDQAEFRL